MCIYYSTYQFSEDSKGGRNPPEGPEGLTKIFHLWGIRYFRPAQTPLQILNISKKRENKLAEKIKEYSGRWKFLWDCQHGRNM